MNSTTIVISPQVVTYLAEHVGKTVEVRVNDDLTISFRESGFRTAT